MSVRHAVHTQSRTRHLTSGQRRGPGLSAGNEERATQTMQIHLASGVGSGPTELAAFDAALAAAGVANYNLLYLSSVIPPAS